MCRTMCRFNGILFENILKLVHKETYWLSSTDLAEHELRNSLWKKVSARSLSIGFIISIVIS